MRIKLLAVCALCLLIVNACREAGTSSPANNNQAMVNSTTNAAGGEAPAPAATRSGTPESKKSETPEVSTNQPKTVRDFYMLLPQKYFTLEGCEPKTDKDCRKARLDYLKSFVSVEDTENGYLSGGCDGAQSCLEMALFKRPGGSYLVGVSTSAEMMQDDYFLDYRGGDWKEVSSTIVPEFSRKNMYKLPRYGTTVQVFAKKVIEKGKDYEISEKGEKLYDLEWKDGKFTIKK
jgi:hypothetical protein